MQVQNLDSIVRNLSSAGKSDAGCCFVANISKSINEVLGHTNREMFMKLKFVKQLFHIWSKSILKGGTIVLMFGEIFKG